MAKRKYTNQGLKLQCPVCGEKDATMLLELDTMICRCGSCDDVFSPDTARRMIGEQLARWEAMCHWIGYAGEILTPVQTAADTIPLPELEIAS